MRQMLKEEQIARQDEKYLQILPEDPNFDPEHNKRVIEETIRATDEQIRRKEREHDEGYKERAKAVASYLKSISQGKSKPGIESYFGRRYLAYLKGKEAVSRMQDKLRVIGKRGNIVREAGQL